MIGWNSSSNETVKIVTFRINIKIVRRYKRYFKINKNPSQISSAKIHTLGEGTKNRNFSSVYTILSLTFTKMYNFKYLNITTNEW